MTDDPHLDDAALSALLDGALPEGDARRLRARLAAEPALAARFAALRRADDAVRSAYRGVAEEPLPERVIALVDLAPARAARPVNVVPRASEMPRLFTRPMALAAGIALAIGLGIGWLVPHGDDAAWARIGPVARGTPLHDALETAPSGTEREIAAGAVVRPRFTFAASDGGYCRQIDFASMRDAVAAVACRRDDGWLIEAAAAAAAATVAGVYRPAAGVPAAIDGAIDERIEGAPLELDAERALLDRGWGTRN